MSFGATMYTILGQVEFLGQRVSVLTDGPISFPKWLFQFKSLLAAGESSVAPHTQRHLVFSDIFILHILVDL